MNHPAQQILREWLLGTVNGDLVELAATDFGPMLVRSSLLSRLKTEVLKDNLDLATGQGPEMSAHLSGVALPRMQWQNFAEEARNASVE